MTPHEIFLHMPPATASQIFTELLEKEKPLYKATIETLAKQRKLRPVFVERKPRNERHAWMQEALGRRTNDAVAAHLLQIWLVATKTPLLCDFLDGLGIAHDEHGTIEDMPPAPEKAKLAEVIESLYTKHDPVVVAIYLNAFQALDDEGWPSLAELLESDSRLQLKAAAVA
ncbi:MAG: hypothetical protein QM796_19085 [Chthoniobacteraceae bacterium]